MVRGYHSSTSTRPYTYEMFDAGGPGSVRASENALERLRPTLVTSKDSIEAERKASFTLSSCLMGSTKEKSSPPLRGFGR